MSTESTLTKRQRRKFGPKVYKEGNETLRIIANVRYDDECGNGHNTFSITANIQRKGKNGQWYEYSGGCCHDEVAKHFPELAPLIKWHLCSSDGPMHYLANTLYFAGDRDCHGRRKREPSRWEHGVRFGNSPVTHRISQKFYDFLRDRRESGNFSIVALRHEPESETYRDHYTFVGFGEKWHECPFTDETEAREFCEAMNTCEVRFLEFPVEFSNGKERELDSARSSAIWPDATDEELTADDLKERLEARLPALLEEFRAAVESLGFTW